MILSRRLLSLTTSLAAIATLGLAASAQEDSTRVAWAPSYGGACEGCNLQGRNMSGWDISNARYRHADLSRSLLRGTRGLDVNFTEATATRTDFRQAVLDGSVFVEARLTEARFDLASLMNADLTQARLGHAKLRGARFNGANLRQADLTSVQAQGADFSGANVSLAIFDGARLSRAQFSNASMTGASFAGAAIDGADFSNVQLRSVDFTGAAGFDTAIFEGACVGPLTKLPDTVAISPCPALEQQIFVDLQ